MSPPHLEHFRASISQTFLSRTAHCCLLRLEYEERSFMKTDELLRMQAATFYYLCCLCYTLEHSWNGQRSLNDYRVYLLLVFHRCL